MKNRFLKVLVGLFIGIIFIMSQLTTASFAAAMPGEQRNDTNKIKIAVTTKGFDDIGAILDELGYPWTEITDEDLTDYSKISPYDVIFANCNWHAANIAPNAVNALQEFVQKGGSLYASDYAYAYVNEAFPGFINFYDDPYIGYGGYVEADVVDPGLANYLNPDAPPATIDLHFDLGAWVPVESVAENTQIYLRGDIETGDGPKQDSPLTVSFRPYADSPGTVIYTAFHNEEQLTEMQEKLLVYLVLIPKTSDIVDQLHQFLKDAGYDVTQTNINTINPGQTSPKFSYTLNQLGDLIFGINWAGSELKLSVFKPDGTLYDEVSGDSPPYMIEIKDAQAGVWQYQVTGVDVPQDNYPYVVAIGDATVEVPGVKNTFFLPLIIR